MWLGKENKKQSKLYFFFVTNDSSYTMTRQEASQKNFNAHIEEAIDLLG